MSLYKLPFHRWLLALAGAVALGQVGCCRTMCGCRPAMNACEPCTECGDCRPGFARRCLACRPHIAARLVGRLHEWQLAAETPDPEPPPMTGLHPVPTSPVFGPRLSGRDAGILAASGIPVEGTEPGPLPIVVPPLAPDSTNTDVKSPAAKTSTGAEHLNRLPLPAVRRASYTTTSSSQKSRPSAGSELRIVR
ncbi:MAG: hypothetical protein JNM18_23040 [Planctomycetaceae bacterium]|nr:hypothetical protein [Planctomycetaceae bacterium]